MATPKPQPIDTAKHKLLDDCTATGDNKLATQFDLPPLSPEEFDSLEESILEHGVQNAVIESKSGRLISGANRKKICDKHGLPCPKKVIDVDDRTAEELALELNTVGRQVTHDTKCKLAEHYLRMDPARSSRQVGRLAGLAPNTVQKIKDKMIADDQIEQLPVKGKEGKTYTKVPSKIVKGDKPTQGVQEPTEITAVNHANDDDGCDAAKLADASKKPTPDQPDIEQSLAEDANGDQAGTSAGKPIDPASSSDGIASLPNQSGTAKCAGYPPDPASTASLSVSDELKAIRDRLCDIHVRVKREPLPDKPEIIRQAGRCARTIDEIAATAEMRE